jgi:hypothetical protein
MTFEDFRAEASRVWEDIPDTYRSGVDGLVVEKKSQRHPSLEEIYTLGECLTESYPSDWGGPDTTRSVLVLYYGSFRKLSELDPDFDWQYEVWETITHELRHHLESLAAEDALEDVDYAMDENFKRLRGDPFDPFFFRSGEPVGPGIYQAERDFFIELEYDGELAPELEVDWRGRRLIVPVPEERGDVAFLQVVEGLERPGEEPDHELCVVLVRRESLLGGVRRWFRREAVAVEEYEVEVGEAEVGEAGDTGEAPE